jgi:hypothetical protein
VVNGYFWVFYGALSNVEYTIRITDTVTGEIKTYFNPDGRLASVADVLAFHGGAAGSVGADALRAAAAAPDVGAAGSLSPARASAAEAACVADTLTLCLAASRFQLRVSWS